MQDYYPMYKLVSFQNYIKNHVSGSIPNITKLYWSITSASDQVALHQDIDSFCTYTTIVMHIETLN